MTNSPLNVPSVSREDTQARIDKFLNGILQPLPTPNWTVMDTIEKLVAERPEHTCLIYEDRALSYKQLDDMAGRYAALAQKCGLKAGEVAAVMIENRPEIFAAWMGLAKIGVTAALINTAALGKALDHAIRETKSKMLFLGAECLGQFAATATCVNGEVKTYVIADDGPLPRLPPACEDIAPALAAVQPQAAWAPLRASVKSNDPAFYIFTSGTTGLPKAALVSHARFLSVGRGGKAVADLNSDEVFYCFLPLFHAAALSSLFSTALACGGTTVVRRKFSTSNFWNEVQKYKVTVFQYSGEICRYLTNVPEQPGEDRNTLKAMWGAGMGVDVWKKFVRRFGSHIRIFEGWGASESNGNMMNFDNKPGSCGRLPYLDKTHVRLVRFDRETESHPRNTEGFMMLCEPDEVGEIICQIAKSDGTPVAPFEGYTDPEETRRKILENVFEKGDKWWRSGDLLRRDAADYYYFVDRIGDTFRWKSENVSTTEVTEQLSAAYADTETINVYGVPVLGHEGQAGMAAIVMKPERKFDPVAFYRIAVDNLPHYAVPLFIRLCKTADMTGTFKMRKVDLRTQGFNRQLVSDPLFALSHKQKSYIPLDDAALAAIGIPSGVKSAPQHFLLTRPVEMADPNYGCGIFRRRVLLVNEPGKVRGELEDSRHGFRVELAHDGESVIGVSMQALRAPLNTCGEAARPLAALVGCPLRISWQDYSARLPANANCTHAHDLAWWAMQHALRTAGVCQYDVAVTDETIEPSECTVHRDGQLVHRWFAVQGKLVTPAELSDKALFRGFSAWSGRMFDGESYEAAVVLQRGYFVAQSRRYRTPPKYLAIDVKEMFGKCYSYSPGAVERAVAFMDVNLDFTNTPELLLKFLRNTDMKE